MKFYKQILKFVFYITGILIIFDVFVVLFFAHYRPEIPKSDSVIILGAAINTPAIKNRTLTGLHLYQTGKADIMVLSGGRISDKDISEARYMEKVIRQNAAVAPPLIIEDQSHNTYDNLKNSKAKLGASPSAIIVSDEFHLARAVLLAKRIGFTHVSWDAPAPTYYSKGELVRYYIREMAAMLWYAPRFVRG